MNAGTGSKGFGRFGSEVEKAAKTRCGTLKMRTGGDG
jgi:hypothetical protein